ncbi:hypothetical protein [Ferruginibacter sp. SUN106]|uniref:hypothetical protein n=1 Tax=Ferruginibacter sp. SUN106 TaxID=2978348 RepID=UPI003D36D44C
MKLILPFLLLLSVSCSAQSADFIIVKKRNKTLQTIYAGNDIAFTTTSGAYIKAYINGIKNDTLFLQEFVINYLPTTFGTYILDTAGSFRYKFHYNQVKALGYFKKKGFDSKGSGASLFGGGVLLTLASGVVYIADRKKFSAPLLIASATLGTLGYFWAKSGGSGLVIGKKYKLVYMDMSNTKR